MLDFHSKQSLSRLRRQLPLHKGAFFMFIYAVSIFLTSTDLNKDIFSCKAKSRRVILSVAYAKSNCGAVRGVAEQDLGREYHPFPS